MDKILVIRTISLIRLIVGGAAMFTVVKTNQKKVIVGEIAINPFVKYILRVRVIS